MDSPQLPPPVSTLWISHDEAMWEEALSRYWSYVSTRNRDLEVELEALSIEMIADFGPLQWYEFLRDISAGNILRPIATQQLQGC